jgi:hypothetical protein
MRPTTVLLPLLLAGIVLLPAPARTHETMPAGWCSGPNETPVIVSTFGFSPAQMHAMADEAEQILGPEGLIAEGLAERLPGGRCGIVDRWNMATYLAKNHCPAATGHPDAIIHITGPTSYGSSTHHGDYDYDGGLHGSCVVCATPGTPILGGP